MTSVSFRISRLLKTILGLQLVVLGIVFFSCVSVYGGSSAEAKIAIVSERGDSDVLALVDHVTVELSKNVGISVLERSEIDLVFREMDLSLLRNMTSSDFASINHILRCDVLILTTKRLSSLEWRMITLEDGVIVDSYTIEWPVRDYETVLRQVVKRILIMTEGQQEDSDSRHLIAIERFVNRDMDREYDYLQDLLPELINSALSGVHGMRLVEREKLYALESERALSGGKDGDSYASAGVLISGDIHVDRIAGDRVVKLDVKGESSVGKPVFHVVLKGNATKPWSLATNAVESLIESLSLRGPRENASHDPAYEAATFSQKALFFRRQSDHQRAAELAEIACILDPDNAHYKQLASEERYEALRYRQTRNHAQHYRFYMREADDYRKQMENAGPDDPTILAYHPQYLQWVSLFKDVPRARCLTPLPDGFDAAREAYLALLRTRVAWCKRHLSVTKDKPNALKLRYYWLHEFSRALYVYYLFQDDLHAHIEWSIWLHRQWDALLEEADEKLEENIIDVMEMTFSVYAHRPFLLEEGVCNREVLTALLNDSSPFVRKMILSALVSCELKVYADATSSAKYARLLESEKSLTSTKPTPTPPKSGNPTPVRAPSASTKPLLLSASVMSLLYEGNWRRLARDKSYGHCKALTIRNGTCYAVMDGLAAGYVRLIQIDLKTSQVTEGEPVRRRRNYDAAVIAKTRSDVVWTGNGFLFLMPNNGLYDFRLDGSGSVVDADDLFRSGTVTCVAADGAGKCFLGFKGAVAEWDRNAGILTPLCGSRRNGSQGPLDNCPIYSVLSLYFDQENNQLFMLIRFDESGETVFWTVDMSGSSRVWKKVELTGYSNLAHKMHPLYREAIWPRIVMQYECGYKISNEPAARVGDYLYFTNPYHGGLYRASTSRPQQKIDTVVGCIHEGKEVFRREAAGAAGSSTAITSIVPFGEGIIFSGGDNIWLLKPNEELLDAGIGRGKVDS